MSSQTPNQTMQARFAGFADDFPDFSYGAPPMMRRGCG
jgi:hypothetical protein